MHIIDTPLYCQLTCWSKTNLICQDPDVLVAIPMETVDAARVGAQRHVVL